MLIEKVAIAPRKLAEEAAAILGVRAETVQVTQGPDNISVTIVEVETKRISQTYEIGGLTKKRLVNSHEVRQVSDVPADKQAAITTWAKTILG